MLKTMSQSEYMLEDRLIVGSRTRPGKLKRLQALRKVIRGCIIHTDTQAPVENEVDCRFLAGQLDQVNESMKHGQPRQLSFCGWTWTDC